MESAKAALTYFSLVFGAGFLLGMIRVPFLVPRLGVRMAELLEMPIMFAAIYQASRFIVRKYRLSTSERVAAGAIALAFLIAAELAFALILAGQSLSSYIVSRDPVSGSVYLLMLVVFALMPLAHDASAATKGPGSQ
jgi:hypothetical protein